MDDIVMELLEKLRATKTQIQMRSLFGGAIALPEPGESREVRVNPDGAEAADVMKSLIAEIKALREALEPFARIAVNGPPDATDNDFAAVKFGDLRHARLALKGSSDAR